MQIFSRKLPDGTRPRLPHTRGRPQLAGPGQPALNHGQHVATDDRAPSHPALQAAPPVPPPTTVPTGPGTAHGRPGQRHPAASGAYHAALFQNSHLIPVPPAITARVTHHSPRRNRLICAPPRAWPRGALGVPIRRSAQNYLLVGAVTRSPWVIWKLIISAQEVGVLGARAGQPGKSRARAGPHRNPTSPGHGGRSPQES